MEKTLHLVSGSIHQNCTCAQSQYTALAKSQGLGALSWLQPTHRRATFSVDPSNEFSAIITTIPATLTSGRSSLTAAEGLPPRHLYQLLP